MRVGDWSDWVPVYFDLIPTQTIGAMARFYLKSVDPDFELYVSPIDIDPMAPVGEISHPASFASEQSLKASDLMTAYGWKSESIAQFPFAPIRCTSWGSALTSESFRITRSPLSLWTKRRSLITGGTGPK